MYYLHINRIEFYNQNYFLFKVYDGAEGAKGEAGIPGRFGYDGFPGMYKNECWIFSNILY